MFLKKIRRVLVKEEQKLNSNILKFQNLSEKVFEVESYCINEVFNSMKIQDVIDSLKQLDIRMNSFCEEIAQRYRISINLVDELQKKYFINQDFSFNDIFNKQVQTILDICERAQYIYESYRTCIIDIRCITEVLNGIKEEFNLPINSLKKKEIDDLIYNTFLKVDCYNNTEIKPLIDKVVLAPSFDESWLLYEENKDFLSEITIIKRNSTKSNNWIPIDVFSAIPKKTDEFPFFSFFVQNKINYIGRRILLAPKNMCTNEKNVTFDTQIISYFKSEEKGKKININLSPIKQFMTSCKKVQFDYAPFIIENYLSHNYDNQMLIKEIDEMEKTYYKFINHPELYKNSYAEQVVSFITKPQILERLDNQYKRIYARLLAIVWVRLKCQTPNKNIQYEKLCNIFSNELFDYAIPELSIAYDFYHGNSSTVKFFKKIQKNRENLIEDIKNMSWDIFNLRSALEQCPYTSSDLFVPYFATYDKGLIDIFIYFQLDALAVCRRTKEFFPYFHINKVPLELQRKYFSVDFDLSNVDIDSFIKKYELQINNL